MSKRFHRKKNVMERVELIKKEDMDRYVTDHEGNIVFNKNGKPKKKPGKPKGTKNIGYRTGGLFNIERQRKVLKVIEETGNISTAAAQAGVSRRTIYNHIEKNPVFAERVELAQARYVAALEGIVADKIQHGVRTKRYDGEGNLVEEIVKDDTQLLLRALERHSKDWSREKESGQSKVEVNINTQGAVEKLADMLNIKREAIEGEFQKED